MIEPNSPELLQLLSTLKAAHDSHLHRDGYRTWQDGGPHPVVYFTAEVGSRYVRVSRMEDWSTGCQNRRVRDGVERICGVPCDAHPKTHAYRFGSGSVVCFVDRQDGNIYYPKGWRGPQKNFPRGNVFTGYERWITATGGIATAR